MTNLSTLRADIDPKGLGIKNDLELLSEPIDPTYVELRYKNLCGGSDKAIWVDFGHDKIWIPLSQSDFNPNDTEEVIWIARWLARKHGLRWLRPRHLRKIEAQNNGTRT